MSERNENRPGYKKTKVGWIPEDWECVQFGFVVNESQYGLSTPTSSDGRIPIIGMAQLKEGRIFQNNVSYVNIKENEFENYRIWADDIIFNRTNSLDLVGKTSVALIDYNCVFASYLVRFSLKKGISFPIFVGYYFNFSDAVTRLKRLATPGVSQYNINPSILKEHFFLPLPSLSEQKKIANILSAWDRTIEQVGKLIDAKQHLKKGLMQKLLTGRMRFPEFGKPATKKEELAEGWKEIRLEECFNERIESNIDLPLLSITSDRGVIPRIEVERKDTSNADKSKYKCIAPNDIGYNTMRMWQGVSAVSDLEGIVSPAYTICIPRKGHHAKFYGYIFKYSPIIHLFWRYSQGLVNDTLSLKFHNFAQIKISCPKENEQKRIASVLEFFDREIELLRKKESALKQQKKGLMQKLLTGKIRVK